MEYLGRVVGLSVLSGKYRNFLPDASNYVLMQQECLISQWLLKIHIDRDVVEMIA